MIGLIAFVFGSIVGSFLNVVIYRLPLVRVYRKREEDPLVGCLVSAEETEGGEPDDVSLSVEADDGGPRLVRIAADEVDRTERLSILFPRRSFCPKCRATIRWYDNIPVLSYLLLRGRCRMCGWRIPARYVFVELLAATLTACTVVRFAGAGWGPTAVYLVLVYTLIAITFIDLKHFIIPNEISIPGIFLGLAMCALFPSLQDPDAFGLGGRMGGVISSALGAVVGGGIIYLVGVAGKLVLKKEAMGGGDVKLMAMVGAFVGWRLVLLSIFFGSFFGSIVGVGLIAARKAEMQTRLPFGPYLALGAVAALFYGNALIAWYFGLLRGPM